MKDIKELLMEEARDNGICVEGYNDMRGFNLDELVDYYIKNPDWCLERSFPSLDLLQTYFSEQEDKGVFVSHNFMGEELNDKLVYIFHDCQGNIETSLNLEKSIIPMLYFANNCDMNIHCDSPIPIKIPIYIFGSNNITTSGNAKFIIYREYLLKKKGGKK